MQLSIIIVTYNVKYFLEQCLYSVQAACKNIDAEVFVIDNASHDNTIELVQPKFSRVNFIKNDVNVGFAKANNEALPLVKGKYVLYLNPDTIIAENTLLNCLDFFEKNKYTGAIGVKMVDGSGNFLPESKRAFPSLSVTFWKMIGMAKLFSKSSLFNKYALGYLHENKVHEVDVLSGAFFMSRKDVLQSVQGFDEDYFMYGEDIDLSYRIQQLGYKNYYLGNTAIVHFKGESTQKQNPQYSYHFYNAMKIFVTKHYTKTTSFFINTSIGFSKWIASLKKQPSIQKNQKKDLYFLLAGDGEAVASAKKILSKNNYHSENINLKKQKAVAGKASIVFCIKDFGYDESIQFIQKNKNKFYYSWHQKLSESIAGSSFRDAAGEIIL